MKKVKSLDNDFRVFNKKSKLKSRKIKVLPSFGPLRGPAGPLRRHEKNSKSPIFKKKCAKHEKCAKNAKNAQKM